MLVEFSVENYRSIRDRQELSMTKGKGTELIDSNVSKSIGRDQLDLLRTAVVYGPNASGKSNFIAAIRTMRDIVVYSASSIKAGDPLPIEPFRLSKSTESHASKFEVTIVVDGVRYQYGFSATFNRIVDEWLIAFPKGRPQTWFDRTWNESQQHYEWDLGNKLTGEKQTWTRLTRENALFLSTAVQLNSNQLKPVYEWFRRRLKVKASQGWDYFPTVALFNLGKKNEIIEFLRAADIDIEDISVEDDEDESNSSSLDVEPRNRPQLESLGNFAEIQFIHKDFDGNDVGFDLSDESEGTRRLFSFAAPWLISLEYGYTLFIDELNNSLHPHLVRYLIESFHSSKRNTSNAQLIFTTHETSVLQQDLFRRDQIWFCDKVADHATTVYPLTDFSPRKGRENLKSAYLSGRYGAIPYLSEVS